MGHAGNNDIHIACSHRLEFELPLQTAKMAAKNEARPKFLGTATDPRHPRQTIVWANVILFVFLHVFALCGLVLIWTQCKWQTVVFGIYLGYIGGLGITAGVHRLWAHRCYKAKWPLRLWLMLHNTVALQNDIYEWSRDHRAHHKFSDANADPHNVTRGFFFAHIGWLLVRKHPEVMRKGGQIDMSDLEADSIVMFQRRYYKILAPVCCFVMPTVVCWYFWGESVWTAFCVAGCLRYTISLHFTWLVNSAAHMWGMRPYDKFINPVENIIVTKLGHGEGWHNYHHAFPYDYRASELGWKYNTAGMFIDACAWLGLAYDRKQATPAMVKARMERTGNGMRLEARDHY